MSEFLGVLMWMDAQEVYYQMRVGSSDPHPWLGPFFWVIFVGIDLIFRGWTWVMVALAVRQFPSTVDTVP